MLEIFPALRCLSRRCLMGNVARACAKEKDFVGWKACLRGMPR
jgi:hypothetical protein